ncbi:MAG: HAD-IIIA family hydrolase [Bacteroidetes bacterium]|nr:HAD-IIIA family hydrolase [Bacteroidota bacterium]
MQDNYLFLLNNITTFVFDVDGVMTNNTITITPDGEQLRTMNIRDGFALQYAVKRGYKIAIISGGKSESVKSRFTKLGVTDIYLGVADKREKLEELISAYSIDPKTILYMGDDLPDYEVMTMVGLPTCPNDATYEIKNIATYVSPVKGGEGCVRDVIEQTLKAQSKWFDASKINDKDFIW